MKTEKVNVVGKCVEGECRRSPEYWYKLLQRQEELLLRTRLDSPLLESRVEERERLLQQLNRVR